MKLLRYQDAKSRALKWGCLNKGTVHALKGDALKQCGPGARVGSLEDVTLAAPCSPTKVIAAAINFHGATDWQPGMTEPLFFLKSPSSVCGPRDKIVSYFSDAPTWGEAELTIVIGKCLSRASTKEAEQGILGYTVANDASAENVGPRDHHLARSKAADTFCPVGPYIDTNYDYRNRLIEGFHNKTLVRKGSTQDFFWDPPKLVHWLSSWMTLEPWDLILTGSPPLQGPLTYFEDGDTFTARVAGFPDLFSVFSQARSLDAKTRATYFQRTAQHV